LHQLTLYGKADCHLCHEARDLLLALQREYEFSLRQVDISTDRALEARYRHRVPVIVVDSEIELAAPIYERELRAVLSRQ
jgi:glutaredoxin